MEEKQILENIIKLEKSYGFSMLAQKVTTNKYNGILVKISPINKKVDLEQMDFLAECFEKRGFSKLRTNSEILYGYSLFINYKQ